MAHPPLRVSGVPATTDLGGIEDYYCHHWGCETFAPWKGQTDSDIQFLRHTTPRPESCSQSDQCNPTTIFVKQGSQASWSTGKTWGVRLYLPGQDLGALFTVQKLQVRRPPNPIGPNKVLNPGPRPIHWPEPTALAATSTLGPDQTPPPGGPADVPPSFPQHSLLRTLDSVFSLLNSSNPESTTECWLCLDPAPPYYVGIAANISVGNSTALVRNLTLSDEVESEDSQVQQCFQVSSHLTLGDVQGEGTCFVDGSYSMSKSPYQSSCSFQFLLSSGTASLLLTPEGTWFACTSGLQRCLSPSGRPELCILTYVIPQVFIFWVGRDGALPSPGPTPKVAETSSLAGALTSWTRNCWVSSG